MAAEPSSGLRGAARILAHMDDVIRLTKFSHGAGCACKLGPSDLAQVLGRLPGDRIPTRGARRG